MPRHMWKIMMAIGALLALKRLQMQAIKLGMGTELLYKMLLVPLFTRRTRSFTDLKEPFQVEE